MASPRSAKIADSIVDTIGNTPLVRLGRLNTTGATILLKLESMNPVGSVKDRLAMGIILKAEKDGIITPKKSVLVEATSGNTGIALAALAAVRGYEMIAVMPESMSQERRCLLSLFGARIVLTPATFGMKGAVAVATKIVKETPNAVYTEQFRTKYNAAIHFETTGPEVWSQTEGKIDFFVAGVGTGGTITGVARYLRSVKSTAKVVAVEPAESPVLSGGKPGPHKIQGIGAGFIPEVYDASVIDEVVSVASDDAIATARKLPIEEGVFAGISAGANVTAALRIAARPENAGKTIVVIVPSFGERYLSTILYQNVKEAVASLPVMSVDEVKELLA